MDRAIEINGIGKQYRLGVTAERLAERVNRILLAPVRALGFGRTEEPGQLREEFWALRNVDAHVDRGEVVGLIGRNGAGKSTLLKLLSRITPPTEGEILLRGRVASLLEVGTGFHPELTGRENIFLNGAILGMREREIAARFDEIAAFSGVERFLDTPVKRYSSGMFVRLAFAVAAHLEPEILLVDEVLAVGDAEFQRKCLDKMQDVSGHGRTIVFVSHNMAAIKRLCTRVYWIDRGEVREEGPAGEVVDSYLTETAPESGEGTVEFGPDAPRFGTAEARFLQATLKGIDGSPTATVGIGEELAVELAFKVDQAIPEAAFEVGVATPDGHRVVTAQTVDFGRPASTLEPGRYVLRAEIGVQMLPGRFAIDLGVHHLGGQTIDYIERALIFTVTNVSSIHPDDYYRWPAVRGYSRPQSNWSLTADEAAQPTSAMPPAMSSRARPM
jgi:lipopolysaccharide transport system ATP-binding protein